MSRTVRGAIVMSAQADTAAEAAGALYGALLAATDRVPDCDVTCRGFGPWIISGKHVSCVAAVDCPAFLNNGPMHLQRTHAAREAAAAFLWAAAAESRHRSGHR